MTAPDRVTVRGTPVVGGVAYAPVMWPGPRPALPAPGPAPEDLDAEVDRFRSAAASVADRLRARASAATGVAAEVLSATAAMAEDRGWIGTAEKSIRAGSPAPNAAAEATETFVAMFTKLGGLMAERVTDLKDVRDRVLAELAGQPEPGITTPDHEVILFADDLAPADTSGLDPNRVRGLVTRLGGPTSHTAIIARQLGIPCVVAVGDLHTVPEGTLVVVDGSAGTIVVEPDAEQARADVAASRRAAEETARWTGPGRTADGVDVAILANVQDGASARTAATHPVAGVGLFRTELAFLDRASEPTHDEQTALYREVIEAFAASEAGSKVVIRTLDAGSDKPLLFADSGTEANPALGVRGLRVAFAHPGLLERQLDAIAAAAEQTGGSPWVMAPMVATAAEARDFAADVRRRRLVAGVMIEIPSAALLAPAILAEVDFVSIGTNDLTQYTMAADRMSAELAQLTDPWQPAVLALIERVAAAGRAADKPVGVCGEAAADPLLACVLVGMGVTSLSSAPAAAAGVGAALARVTMAQCMAAAHAALDTAAPADARAAAAAALRS
ncbi:phosphoenolpyruvate--protein phosphotransferase [Williamsia sp. CHRR-6]|uniref:phosphoenolpyruvate--protein phosphotransferase n=1 Tax=Williamsia sp. CHRR-6 TaxID=2835871 RepID=UPI001BDB6CD6|nr:phosphoenolpyruvate--protein phosphotransferase [Williamsia sp. CHRR-6]MBT0567912.1 phosphoenolpyruvate--protein phosphotransferase [Williamsia sp. CHRR-6]